MNVYRLTTAAALDLDEIWEYIAQQHPLNADGFIRQILAVATMLAGSPRMGKSRPELGTHVRCHPVGAYLIVYRPFQEGISVIRVYHSARRLTAETLKKRGN